ncbi:hypothetical protein NORO109296_13475 [Nocardiopsis rhodophaea]
MTAEHDQVPAFPKITAVTHDDGTGELTINGSSQTITAASVDDARAEIINLIAETAEKLGRPVKVATSGVGGEWPLIIHPDARVEEDSSAPSTKQKSSRKRWADRKAEPRETPSPSPAPAAHAAPQPIQQDALTPEGDETRNVEQGDDSADEPDAPYSHTSDEHDVQIPGAEVTPPAYAVADTPTPPPARPTPLPEPPRFPAPDLDPGRGSTPPAGQEAVPTSDPRTAPTPQPAPPVHSPITQPPTSAGIPPRPLPPRSGPRPGHEGQNTLPHGTRPPQGPSAPPPPAPPHGKAPGAGSPTPHPAQMHQGNAPWAPPPTMPPPDSRPAQQLPPPPPVQPPNSQTQPQPQPNTRPAPAEQTHEVTGNVDPAISAQLWEEVIAEHNQRLGFSADGAESNVARPKPRRSWLHKLARKRGSDASDHEA